MYYLCLKTLATKHRMYIKSVIQTYGYKDIQLKLVQTKKPNPSNLRIAVKYQFNNNV